MSHPKPALKLALVALAAALIAGLDILWTGSPGESGDADFVACVRERSPEDVARGLDDPAAKTTARMLMSSAENSTVRWEEQYGYIEYNVEGNNQENRGYTAGLVGFTSRTGDMLKVVETYAEVRPDAPLVKFLPALREVNGTPARIGPVSTPFMQAWQEAGADEEFQRIQRDWTDRLYFDPAVRIAREDGLRTLGEFIYVDAAIMHGFGSVPNTFEAIHEAARKNAQPPAQGGDETVWLNAFLDARRDAMLAEIGHSDVTRVDTAQRVILREGNMDLQPPLKWAVYGDGYEIRTQHPLLGCR